MKTLTLLITAALSGGSLAQEPEDNEFYDEDFSGFEILSDEGGYRLAIGGKLENDWAFFSTDKDVELFSDSFDNGTEFRRARLSLAGDYQDWLAFKTSFDFQGSGSSFRDLYAEIQDIPALGRLKVGHFKEPFSLEALTSSSNMSFMERSLLTALSPGRNVGVMARNSILDRRATWALGLFRETDSAASGVDEGGGQEFALTGRATWIPFRKSKGRRLLHFGLGASLRNPDLGEVRFRSRPEAHLAPRIVDTGGIRADSTLLINLESALIWERATLQAEYTLAQVDAAFEDSLGFAAYYLQGAWMITGELRPYRRSSGTLRKIVPDSPFQGAHGGWGAWEAALRFSGLDLTEGSIGGGEVQVLSAALNWHLTDNLRISLDSGVADLETFGNSRFVQLRFHLDW